MNDNKYKYNKELNVNNIKSKRVNKKKQIRWNQNKGDNNNEK